MARGAAGTAREAAGRIWKARGRRGRGSAGVDDLGIRSTWTRTGFDGGRCCVPSYYVPAKPGLVNLIKIRKLWLRRCVKMTTGKHRC